jgi:hypothetical protein
MDGMRSFPSRDRLSVLTAVIVLAYALARFLDLPSRALGGTFFGSALGIELNGKVLMMLLIAALISAGSDTLIRSHPVFAGGAVGNTVIYWILPGATALVLGAALNRLPDGLAWWLGLGTSAVALIVVLIAEYVVVERDAPLRAAAVFALTALVYALALILFVLLHSVSARAAISATVGGLVAAALAWRLFALQSAPLGRASLYAALAGLICAEAIWALNYWRVPSSSAALMVMIPFYICVGLGQQHLAGRLTRRVWIEFAVVGGLGLLIALLYTFA